MMNYALFSSPLTLAPAVYDPLIEKRIMKKKKTHPCAGHQKVIPGPLIKIFK